MLWRPSSSVRGDRAQAADGGVDEVRLRLQAMQEEGEDAGQARVEVDLRLAPPHQPIVEDGLAAQVRADQVAVKALIEGVAGIVAELVEAP